MIINVLGKEYTITVKKFDEDDTFKRSDVGGYCSSSQNQIAICDMKTYPDWEDESDVACDYQMKRLLRHEIVHAFLIESGLSANSCETDAWANNEEMVDWIAIQGPKIYKAWQEADAL